MFGSYGVGKWQFVGVVVCGETRPVGVLRSVRGIVCGSCGVWKLQCAEVAVFKSCCIW